LSSAIYGLLAKERNKASVVVMNTARGHLYAIVDYPGHDVDSDIEPDARTSLDALHAANLPASTLKLLSAAYVLERRPGDASRSYECTGDRCWTRHGTVRGLEHAVVASCNVWFRLASADWPRADWVQFVLEAGLQPPDTPGLPLAPVVMVGHQPNRPHWPHVVGQQIWVSLVGLATAFATVTSDGGRRINPRVLMNEGSIAGSPRIVKPAVAKRLGEILWRTAREGTARGVNQVYVRRDAGAKTGTAEVDGKTSDAVFAAMAPWHKPEWVVVVTLKGRGRGASIGPIAGRVLNLVLQTNR
jgi:cell division protein FtsI/penicillin-binding protein 2